MPISRSPATELPQATTKPLDWAAGALAAMTDAEQTLARQLAAGQPVCFAARTASTVDVGRWSGPGRLWALALPRELALLAHGPRPFAERIPFSLLRESTYNPVTGEVVLAPAPHHAVRGLRLPPLEGYQLLAQIYREDESNAPTAR